MAKWTGKIKRVKRWFRSDELFVQFRVEEGDHNPPEWPELYWEPVNAYRLDVIAFDLQCRRDEVETLTKENARLREKLVSVGSDTKIEVTLSSPRAAEELATRLSKTMKETAIGFIQKHADWIRQPGDVDLKRVSDCKKHFSEQELEPFDLAKLAGGYQPHAMPAGAQPPKGR